MSTFDSPFQATDSDEAEPTRWERLEAGLHRLSEWLNPILVKEARQALKSKQFVITFSLLLGFGWAWTFLGVLFFYDSGAYQPFGLPMLMGYYFVIAFPLTVVVPFSAFRSLAAEREDGTYELVSITTLTSRQIITGKLGSSILQIIVYYSAISPAIVFTYMLRGVDVVTIFLVLFYTFLVSVLLAAKGLLFATVTSSRTWQALLSVVLIMSLLSSFVTWSYIVGAVLWGISMPYEEPVFWAANLCIICFYATFLELAIRGAAAKISFASDNRSTRLRAVMLVQQILWIGWMTYFWIEAQAWPVLLIAVGIAVVYWAIAGSLMCGEVAELSPRAQRELPQSFLGRMALTWFNPGSGTGYVFAVLSFSATAVVVILLSGTAQGLGLAIITLDSLGSIAPDSLATWCRATQNELLQSEFVPHDGILLNVSILLCAYLAAYLGIARIVHVILSRSFYVGLMFSLLTTILLLVLGAALPVFVEIFLHQPDIGYSELQASNWIWTLFDSYKIFVEGDDSELLPFLTQGQVVLGIVCTFAALVFMINLLLTTHEIGKVRQEAPDRVASDDDELEPSKVKDAARGPWSGDR